MPKAWLRERWETLIPALEKLTVAEEGEIARLCEQERAYFYERFAHAAPSSLGEPMSDTRARVKAIPLTEDNSYVTDAGQREHLALKYLNYSQEEWRRIKKPSDASRRRREENMRYLEEPERIVEVATELLSSKQWAEVVVGLAVVTGRRLAEIMKEGTISPKSLHAVWFKGHLKNKKLGLRGYEIPVLCEASKVLSAWSRLRRIVDCSKMEGDLLSKTYGAEVSEAAERHFAALVPPVYGDAGLSSKTFRKVYARLAVFFLCTPEKNELEYFPAILGHYWEDEDGEEHLNVQTSVAYTDYDIGDRAVMCAEGKRKGVWLNKPGVEPIDLCKPRAEADVKGNKRVTGTPHLTKVSQRGNTIITVKDATKERTDLIGSELGARIQDDTITRLCDDYYRLRQVNQLLTPYYEQLGVQIDEDGQSLDAPLLAVEVLVDLLHQAGQDAEGKLNEGKKPFTPFGYLKSLLTSKRQFLAAYGKRHEGKDYTKLSLTQLKRTKTTEAAAERFRRAVDAIMAYNDQAQIPEQRWYINAAAITDLVDGRPGAAKAYIEGDRAAEIQAHHEKHNLHPGDNRKSVKITARITVPDLPAGAEAQAETEETEEVSEP